ncbi:MAG TPA: polymer-forming cytoskeletal protein [Fibrobacteraceae bacterium]|nr:polymer-forming cytoskeletal protein [Fibrobacteraceae bacterium]
MTKPNNPGQLTTLSSSTTVVGDVNVDNDIRIAGTLRGKLVTTGHLIVEASGLIEGEVKANAATIAGRINGNVETAEKLVLEPKAIVVGDIQTRLLIIEDGASFNGNCAMDGTATVKRPVDVKLT